MQPIALARATHLLAYVELLRRIGTPVERELRRAKLPSLLPEIADRYIPAVQALNFLDLLLAQRRIAMGTAYAVWTGIGAVGTFLIGIALFGEAATPARFFFVGLIVAGIIGLKFAAK